MAAVLFLSVLKTKYDITGTWTFTITYLDQPNEPAELVFVGDKKSGEIMWQNSKTGEYTVDGKKVTMIIGSGSPNMTYIGEFIDKNHLNGTWTYMGLTGTWSAVKQNATTSYITPSAVSKAPFVQR